VGDDFKEREGLLRGKYHEKNQALHRTNFKQYRIILGFKHPVKTTSNPVYRGIKKKKHQA
jgi:hypothetical protein